MLYQLSYRPVCCVYNFLEEARRFAFAHSLPTAFSNFFIALLVSLRSTTM
jgi:hypothetical protein